MGLMRQYILHGSEATSLSSPRRNGKSGPHRLSVIRLSTTLLFLVMFLVPLPLLGHDDTESKVPSLHEYRLRFYHTHTGERLDVVYRRGDQYIPAALDELDHYLRDHRTGDVHHFDPHLFDLLYDLTASLGDSGGEIDVICGYRTPWSNEFLRTRHPHTAWPSTACICRPKRSTFACVEFRQRNCATQPCACIAEEWGTIAVRTSCTSTLGVCASGSQAFREVTPLRRQALQDFLAQLLRFAEEFLVFDEDAVQFERLVGGELVAQHHVAHVDGIGQCRIFV